MKLTDHTFDAIVALTSDPKVDQAFMGQDTFSPMLRALQILLANDLIRRVHLVLNGATPAPHLAEVMRDPRVVVAPNLPQSPTPANGAALKALARWNPWRSMWGPMAVTEFCATLDVPRLLALHTSLRDAPDAYLIVSATLGMPTAEMFSAVLDAAVAGNLRESFTIADGPRGLIAPLLKPRTLNELADLGIGVGVSPWRTRSIVPKLLAPVPGGVRTLRRSFSLADDLSRAFVGRVAQALGERANTAPLEEIAAAARADDEGWRGDLPRHIELEVTSRRPFTPDWLPFPQVADQDMTLAGVEYLAETLSPESTLLTLGGLGDALLHPNLFDVLKILRGRCAGLAVRTFGTSLDAGMVEKLGEAGVEIINLRLGHWRGKFPASTSDDLLKDGSVSEGEGGEAAAVEDRVDEEAAMLRLLELQATRCAAMQAWCYPMPLLIPEVTKTVSGDQTLLHFLEQWYEKRAWPLVTSVNRYGGHVEGTQALLPRPGQRSPCIRLEGQMWIRSNGDVVLCQQHHDGSAVGNVFATPLREIWLAQSMKAAWQAHCQGRFDDGSSRCGACSEWYRLT